MRTGSIRSCPFSTILTISTCPHTVTNYPEIPKITTSSVATVNSDVDEYPGLYATPNLSLTFS